jgi:putative DNA primase/helicase
MQREAQQGATGIDPWARSAGADRSSRQNAIRQVTARDRQVRSSRSGAAEQDSQAPIEQRMPEVVQKHFVQVGTKFYFSDGTHAFTDHHTKLTTHSENTQLIRDLVTIAQSRGWSEIAVSGTEHFRREAWASARAAGLAVRGYKPDAVEEAKLAKLGLKRADLEAPVVSGPSNLSSRVTEGREARVSARPEAHERSHTGVLLTHGPAPYRHDPREPMSYVVRLETRKGEQEVWGVDLERALRESLSRPNIGDEVVLRAVGREPVKVRSEARDIGGERRATYERETHRNRWQIETRAFLSERKEAARVLRDPTIEASHGSQRHPELVGAYLQLHAAELAAKQFRDVEDRRRFMSMVREAVAQGVARGEPLPTVRLRHSKGTEGKAERASRDRSSDRGRVR